MAAAVATQPATLGPGVAARGKRRRPADVSSSDSDSSTSSGSSSLSSFEARVAERAPLDSGLLVDQGITKVEVESSSDSSSSSDEDAESEVSDLSCEEEVDLEVEAIGSLKDLIFKNPEVPIDPSYRGDWSRAPSVGSRGFNSFAAKAMKHAGVASKALDAQMDTGVACPPLQPHQEVVQFLLHPQSPVSRLLVDHPTGSGKTREMIAVLDNFFHDPRPKVPIFPKEPVCRNFYLELLRWPSRYRDFFACLRPHDAARLAGAKDWQTRRDHVWDVTEVPDEELKLLIANIRDVLEMKGWFQSGKMKRSRRDAFERRFPAEKMMGAPLRALRYTSAGGKHTELKDGMPMSALLKVAFDFEGKNVYSNKIVIMDEVHNLVRAQTQFAEQLSRLREFLLDARGIVLAGFTGTPILSEPLEGRYLLDIVKGRHYATCSDQGFLSSFPMRPRPLFPRTLPRGVPDAVLTAKLRRKLLVASELKGECLKRYDLKRSKGLVDRRLQRYCNLGIHFGAFHDGKSGCKAKILGNMQAYAPKLYNLAASVASSKLKALVLIPRNSGMEAFLLHLQALGARSNPKFRVATMDELAAFNASNNRHGERYRVLVADATTCSEGVSFFAVRQVHLAEIPVTPSAFVQSVGRSVRMYGHRGLPEEEQMVTVSLHVATFPSWMRSPLGAWALRAHGRLGDTEDIEKKAKHLLRQLRKAGITDIEKLKLRIDACAERTMNIAPIRKKDDAIAKKAEDIVVKKADEQSECEQIQPPSLASRDLKIKVEVKEEPDDDVKGKFKEDIKDEVKEEKPVLVKEPLPSSKVVELYEQFGLWEEAKAERLRMSRYSQSKKRNPRQRPRKLQVTPMRLRPSKSSASSTAAKTRAPHKKRVTSEQPPASGAPKLKEEDMTLADLGKQVKREQQQQAPLPNGQFVFPKLDTDSSSPMQGGSSAVASTAPSDDRAALPPYWRRDSLASAIQLLYLAPSAQDAVRTMNLNSLTADEEALRELARRSREFVPALAELRSKAMDRALLRQLCGEPEALSSDGESSEPEFAVSSSDGEGNDGQPREADLVLPPGWRTEKFRRKTREVREYVDPAGTRYRTMPEARRAVDLARARENMSQRMRSKFASALSEVNRGQKPGL